MTTLFSKTLNLNFKATCDPGVTAQLFHWMVLQWSSRLSSQGRLKACTPAGLLSITTKPPSTFKWKSGVRMSSSVSTCVLKLLMLSARWSVSGSSSGETPISDLYVLCCSAGNHCLHLFSLGPPPHPHHHPLRVLVSSTGVGLALAILLVARGPLTAHRWLQSGPPMKK